MTTYLNYYERHALDAVANTVRRFRSPVLLVDCGADVGVYARLLLHRGVQPTDIITVEPNSRTFPILKANLAGLVSNVICFNGAVGDTRGRGGLQTPDYDPNQDRAAFITMTDEGDIEVETVDHLAINTAGSSVVLKVDVEGAELEVIRGATETLRKAEDFVVQFEAHPAVAARSANDPMECLKHLISLGAKHWLCSVEETGEIFTDVTPDRPFFEVMSDAHIYDVVASTQPLQAP